MTTRSKRRVLVVGAGAAGMSCATALAQHPDRFDVTLIEAQDYCGGQMFSIPLSEERFGAAWLNQGVQGYVFIGLASVEGSISISSPGGRISTIIHSGSSDNWVMMFTREYLSLLIMGTRVC